MKWGCCLIISRITTAIVIDIIILSWFYVSGWTRMSPSFYLELTCYSHFIHLYLIISYYLDLVFYFSFYLHLKNYYFHIILISPDLSSFFADNLVSHLGQAAYLAQWQSCAQMSSCQMSWNWKCKFTECESVFHWKCVSLKVILSVAYFSNNSFCSWFVFFVCICNRFRFYYKCGGTE